MWPRRVVQQQPSRVHVTSANVVPLRSCRMASRQQEWSSPPAQAITAVLSQPPTLSCTQTTITHSAIMRTQSPPATTNGRDKRFTTTLTRAKNAAVPCLQRQRCARSQRCWPGRRPRCKTTAMLPNQHDITTRHPGHMTQPCKAAGPHRTCPSTQSRQHSTATHGPAAATSPAPCCRHAAASHATAPGTCPTLAAARSRYCGSSEPACLLVQLTLRWG